MHQSLRRRTARHMAGSPHGAKALSVAVIAAFMGLAALAQPANAIEREYYIHAVEHKGRTKHAVEPFPAKPLEEEAGMKVKQPDATGTWAVEAYAFSPAQISVVEGDLVILHFIGINGAIHNISIEGVKATKIMRGRMTTVRFVASKPGIIPITCFDHQPNMNAQIVVLAKDPRGSQ